MYPNHSEKKKELGDLGRLYAANGSKIATYGEEILQLKFGSNLTDSWVFIVANVQYPI